MFYVQTTLGPSVLHGTGCFANQKIKKGDVVWKYDEGLDIFLTKETYEHLPKIKKDFFDHYAYWSDELNGYVCAADNHRFTNHSTDPNIGTIGAKEGDDGEDVALRDIEPGEEMTVDYRVFGEDPEQER